MSRPKPLILAILDGFGMSSEKEGNPVASARTPTFNELERVYPFISLQASGTAVGLPWGEAGNSEVGHLTMGAGRAVYHHLPRIINAIHDGSFFTNESLRKATDYVKKNNSRLHIAGLISSGSVHGYLDHVYALLDLTKREKVPSVYLHVFTDGKDAPPRGGAEFLAALEERIRQEWPHAEIASVVGRFYALDRDEKWDRTEAAYRLLTDGKGEKISSVPEYLQKSYKEGLTDDLIKPAIVAAEGTVQENDVLIFSDFREDSMRQLARAFAKETFDKFPRGKRPALVITMTEYEKGLALPAFPRIDISKPLAEILGDAGLKHLHIAETQKYAHVTYFFNGGREKPFVGEERILVPSRPEPPEEIPDMEAREIARTILARFNNYDVVIANFANADLVGHSGNFQTAINAVEVLDEVVGELMSAVLNSSGVLIVTGDHGNIELKRNVATGEKLTKHSLNPVPFFQIGKNFRRATPRTDEEVESIKKSAGGILTDVAPTMLGLLELEQPDEMTGKSLLAMLTG